MKRRAPDDLEVSGISDALNTEPGSVCYGDLEGLEADADDDMEERIAANEARLKATIDHVVQRHRLYDFARIVEGSRGVSSSIDGGFDTTAGRRIVDRIVSDTRRAHILQRAISRVECERTKRISQSQTEVATRQGIATSLEALRRTKDRLVDPQGSILESAYARVKAFGDAAGRYKDHIKKHPPASYYSAGGGGGGPEESETAPSGPEDDEPDPNDKYPYIVTVAFPGAIPRMYFEPDVGDEGPLDTLDLTSQGMQEYAVPLELLKEASMDTLKTLESRIGALRGTDEHDDTLDALSNQSVDVLRDQKQLSNQLSFVWKNVLTAVATMWNTIDGVATSTGDIAARTSLDALIRERNRAMERVVANVEESGVEDNLILREFSTKTTDAVDGYTRVEFPPLFERVARVLNQAPQGERDRTGGTIVSNQFVEYVKENRDEIQVDIGRIQGAVRSIYSLPNIGDDASSSNDESNMQRMSQALALSKRFSEFLKSTVQEFQRRASEAPQGDLPPIASPGTGHSISAIRSSVSQLRRRIYSDIATLRGGKWVVLNSDIKAAMSDALTYLQTYFPNAYGRIKYPEPIAASKDNTAVSRFANLTALMLSRHQLQFNAAGYSQLGRTGQINNAIAQAGIAMARLTPRPPRASSPDASLTFR